jgi:hypothetical protein
VQAEGRPLTAKDMSSARFSLSRPFPTITVVCLDIVAAVPADPGAGPDAHAVEVADTVVAKSCSRSEGWLKPSLLAGLAWLVDREGAGRELAERDGELEQFEMHHAAGAVD